MSVFRIFAALSFALPLVDWADASCAGWVKPPIRCASVAVEAA